MSMDDADFEALHKATPAEGQDAEELAEHMRRLAADLSRVAHSYLQRDPLDVSRDERIRLSEAVHRMISAQMLFNDQPGGAPPAGTPKS